MVCTQVLNPGGITKAGIASQKWQIYIQGINQHSQIPWETPREIYLFCQGEQPKNFHLGRGLFNNTNIQMQPSSMKELCHVYGVAECAHSNAIQEMS